MHITKLLLMVYIMIHDENGFKNECQQAKAWGMDGKTLIHPKQIAWANDILGPSDEEIDYAHSVVRCWEDAVNVSCLALPV